MENKTSIATFHPGIVGDGAVPQWCLDPWWLTLHPSFYSFPILILLLNRILSFSNFILLNNEYFLNIFNWKLTEVSKIAQPRPAYSIDDLIQILELFPSYVYQY